YFPGEHFLLAGQIFLKQEVNKIYPVFSLVKQPKNNFEVGYVKRFLEVLSKAPVDFSKVKIIVFLLDQPSCMDSRFAAWADSLVKTPAWQPVFGNCLKVIDCNKVLDKSDYYSFDRHIRASGHKKVADQIEQVLKNF